MKMRPEFDPMPGMPHILSQMQRLKVLSGLSMR
jgi:hypothetical protein